MVGAKRKRLSETPSEPTLRRVAAYVRMSTDHQKYSTDNQMDAIRGHAAKNGIEIVRVYADEGKSGCGPRAATRF